MSIDLKSAVESQVDAYLAAEAGAIQPAGVSGIPIICQNKEAIRGLIET